MDASIPLVPVAEALPDASLAKLSGTAWVLQGRPGLLAAKDEPARLRELAEEFTAVFLGQFFRLLDSDPEVEGIGFGGGAERIFREFSYDDYAEEVARGKGFGLSDLVYQGLLRRARLASDEAEAVPGAETGR
ncbi:MAG: rod-binding protein [Planctomycetota bacterium]